jgi:hypothetical protein
VGRIAAALIVVGIAVVVARVAAPSHASHFRYSAALACGVERWKVKTLQDRPRLLRVHSIPIAQLVVHERPTPLPATRLPFERHIFSVDAAGWNRVQGSSRILAATWDGKMLRQCCDAFAGSPQT